MAEYLGKNIFKIGEMYIDVKQVFWRKQYIYACIPFYQISAGHILLVPRRQVCNFKQLEPAQIFDLALATKFLCKSLEAYNGCSSTTVYIQNSTKQEGQLGHMIVHIFPRKPGDLKNNDDIYVKINQFPSDLIKTYQEKIALYRNAYADKILEGIQNEAKKIEQFLNAAYKQQQQF